MNALPLVSAKAERDGCGHCVDMNVERCAHWNGHVLYLALRTKRDGWRVSIGKEGAAIFEGDRLVHTVVLDTLDPDAALAAYHAAEARLLGRAD